MTERERLILRCNTLSNERDELAAQVEVMREVLRKLACRGNGGTYGNSTGNRIAQDALALRNTAILRQRDARVLREAANEITYGGTVDASEQLRAMADELERKNG